MQTKPIMEVGKAGLMPSESQVGWITKHLFRKLVQNFINDHFPYACLKITEKVSFNIASEASYVYILSGQKVIKNAKTGQFGEFLKP